MIKVGPVLRLSMTPILGTHTQLVHPKRWEWMWDCDPITESVQRWPVSSNNPRFVWNSGSVYMVRFETICLLYVDLTYINKREQILQKNRQRGIFSTVLNTNVLCSVHFFLKKFFVTTGYRTKGSSDNEPLLSLFFHPTTSMY